jgi:SPP1 gp7 family putative phage head morphogenesis protein
LNDLYSERCSCCGELVLHDLTDTNADWEGIYTQIAQQLLDGSATDINTDLYFKTAGDLMQAINKGLGGSSFTYDNDRNQLVAALQKNIYPFSAAKSLVQMIQYRDMMIGADGKLLSFASFKKVIADQGEIFNNKYLQVEHQHAMQSAIMAHKWDTLDSEYLEFSTVGDSRVRPEHKALDKFTAPKNDPVWRRIYPPLAWGCRCTVIPGKANYSEKKMTAIEAGAMMKPYVKDTIFDNNVGLSQVIFKDDHPYFKNAKGDVHNLSWEQYGLQSLDKIRANPLDEYKPTTKEEYLNWWAKQPKLKGDDIVFKDALNNEILISSSNEKRGNPNDFFKEHILIKESEKRFEYGTETPNILKNADEIWSNKQGRIYIKYYEKGTLKLVVDDKLEAKTLFQLHNKSSGELNKSRMGILLYKK